MAGGQVVRTDAEGRFMAAPEVGRAPDTGGLLVGAPARSAIVLACQSEDYFRDLLIANQSHSLRKADWSIADTVARVPAPDAEFSLRLSGPCQ